MAFGAPDLRVECLTRVKRRSLNIRPTGDDLGLIEHIFLALGRFSGMGISTGVQLGY